MNLDNNLRVSHFNLRAPPAPYRARLEGTRSVRVGAEPIGEKISCRGCRGQHQGRARSIGACGPSPSPHEGRIRARAKRPRLSLPKLLRGQNPSSDCPRWVRRGELPSISDEGESVRPCVEKRMVLTAIDRNVLSEPIRINLEEHILVLPATWERTVEQMKNQLIIAI